jgi:hypothetical protein
LERNIRLERLEKDWEYAFVTKTIKVSVMNK